MAKKTRETLGGRIANALGLTRKTESDVRSRRSYVQGYREGRESVSLDPNDDPADASLGIAAGGFGFRRSSSRGREGGITFEDNIKTAWDLWQSNGILQRDAEITRDYVAGGNVEPVTHDDELQNVLDAFIEKNSIERRVGEFTLQLGVLGTQCYPAFVRKTDGAVTLGYIDPEEIDEVITDPENAMDVWAVVLKPQQATRPWESANEKRVYRIIRSGSDGKLETADQATLNPWERVMLKAFSLEQYTGQCFYVKTNAFSNQPTGYSDFLATADLSDQWDQTLFALGQREQFADFFSFDVTANGLDEEDCREKARAISQNPPARGSVNVHNEEESWQIFAPDLKQTSSVATAQEQRRNVIAALGKPEAWFGSASGSYLATVQAQGDPTWRSLKYRQNEIKWLLEDIFRFVRDQAIIAGSYTPEPDADTSIDVQMPEMTSDDVIALSTAISSITTAMMMWEDRGWVSRDIVGDIVKKLVSEFGVDASDNNIDENAAVMKAMQKPTSLADPKDWFEYNAPFDGGE